jgi:hypothetical protein
MKDIVDQYNGARAIPAPKQMLDDAIAEVVRLRKLVAELEAENEELCSLLEHIAKARQYIGLAVPAWIIDRKIVEKIRAKLKGERG